MGVYHWSGKEALNKYDMVKIMSEAFNLSMNHIEANPNPGSGTKRPHNTQLSCERLNKLGIGRHTRFENGVKTYFKKFIEN